ncbi:hypothetical protein [Natronobiforma cellulositropha]|uniref:hypothetical protein n=1 Tax=Natronobiforma cellulositropha TaxID=1679076 RepID=UPI0021D6155A|nr:hypothetical protein [Natronobiforma cellulositropha]
MSDDGDSTPEDDVQDTSDAEENGGEEKTFRERVEEIREKRAQEAEESGGDPFGGPGGPGGPGGMGGGNPFAQMMSGMMGGGPGGPGGESTGDEELVREVRQLRDEVRDVTRQLQRIADALEDD